MIAGAFLAVSALGIAAETVPDGVQKRYFSDGRVREEANYAGGKRDGVARQFLPTGEVASEALYQQGTLQKMKVFKLGKLAKAIDYTAHTFTEYSPEGGVTLEAVWTGQDGTARSLDDAGRVQSTTVVRNGELVEKKEFFKDGSVKSLLAVEAGRAERKVYDEKGQLREVSHLDGSKKYDSELRLIEESDAKGRKLYDRDGRLREESVFEGNQIRSKSFYPDGKLSGTGQETFSKDYDPAAGLKRAVNEANFLAEINRHLLADEGAAAAAGAEPVVTAPASAKGFALTRVFEKKKAVRETKVFLDGRLFEETSLEAGLRNGPIKRYYESGGVEYEGVYQSGRVVQGKSFVPGGLVKEQDSLQNQIYTYTVYSDSGKKRLEHVVSLKEKTCSRTEYDGRGAVISKENLSLDLASDPFAPENAEKIFIAYAAGVNRDVMAGKSAEEIRRGIEKIAEMDVLGKLQLRGVADKAFYNKERQGNPGAPKPA